MIKLGTQVTDTSTGQTGMLTLMQIELNNSRYYYFQPRAINKNDGLPSIGRWVVDAPIEGGIEIPDIKLPEGILGSAATDSASGLTGKITAIRLHVNGCLHVSLQSDKVLESTGTVPDSFDVDMRRIVGEKVPILSEEQLIESKEKNPSPESVRPYSPKFR